jgi:hypothetical protein
MVRVHLGVESRIRSEQVADTRETQLHQSEPPVVSKVRNYNKDFPFGYMSLHRPIPVLSAIARRISKLNCLIIE